MSLTIHQREYYDRAELEELADGKVLLNLGCGDDSRGIGVDINYSPDIMHDLNDGIPTEDGTADAILAEHVLEHLDNPTHFLSECKRVLRSDGDLYLEVPNAGWWPVRAWLSTDLHQFWRHKDPSASGHWLARRLGNTDEERTRHKSLWTKALLEQYLENAGFAYTIEQRHWSRNLSVHARLETQPQGQTLHELERAAGEDIASDDYWAQTRARLITRWIDARDSDSVLDVGCGSGYLTAAIARADRERAVRGIDINESSIAVARERSCPATFAVGDAYDLPGDEWGCLVYGDVLEHFEAPERLLREARAALADDGAIIVSVPAFMSLYGPHDEHNGHYERYDRERLRTVAAAAGLSVEQTQFTNVVPLIPYFVYQRVLRRPVPDSARGSHGGVVGTLKRAAIAIETHNPLPVGVTLIGELTHA